MTSNYNYWYTPEPKDVWHYRFINDADPIYWKATEFIMDRIKTVHEHSYGNPNTYDNEAIDTVFDLLGEVELPATDAQLAYATALSDWNDLLRGGNK